MGECLEYLILDNLKDRFAKFLMLVLKIFRIIREIKKNITLLDFFLLPLAIYQKLLRIIEITKNWPEVILFRLGIKKRFVMKLRNGEKIKIENYEDYFNFLISRSSLVFLPENIKVDKTKRQIEFNYKNQLVRLSFPTIQKTFYDPTLFINYLLYIYKEKFIKEPYKWLNVKGREVVDVGAYVGDSAIYFALNGAKHVYAFEPHPSLYKIAKKNVKLNNLEKKITLLNEAIGDESKAIYIDEKYGNLIGDDIKELKKGRKVKVTTLEDIVKRFKLKNAVLKMNCVGCEYCSILNTQDKVFKKFKQIMIKYFYGYLNLKKKLEEVGFKVKVSLPTIYFLNSETKNSYRVVGFIYAQRLKGSA